MPPPKPKLYKTGKLKIIKKPQQPEITSNVQPSSSNQLDSDSDQQFELELAWCIQTMEGCLNEGKLNAKQAEDTTKTLKLLKSSNQSIIRKRQIMRSSFGDYRSKMAEEAKKFRLGRRQIQFSTELNSKSFFVKRSALSTIGKDKDFKFNFPTSADIPIEQLNLSDSKDINEFGHQTNGISYAPTDNSFRFNFEVVEET